MNDKSLLKDLELFQELTEQEVTTVAGGIDFSKLTDNCLACLSGIVPLVLQDNYQDVIKPTSSLGLQSTHGY